MKTKLLLAISALAVLSGCSTTTPANMDVVDLNYYRIDCSRQEEQLAFLQRQIPTRQDRLNNGLRMTSVAGSVQSVVEGTYTENRATFDQRQQAIADNLIVSIRRHCPKPQPRPQSCLTITESMPSGASGGTQCRLPNGKPALTRWEAFTND